MKIILAALTVGLFAISSSFAQCGGGGGGCGDKKSDEKKEGKKETATQSVKL
jgi:hypothetical protein